MQEWLVFSDYAPESNLIPTFVIVPFFNKFVFLNHAPETYLIVTIVIVQFSHLKNLPILARCLQPNVLPSL